MTNSLLQEENWADYDNKKIRDGRDSRFFACTEQWEVDHLKKLLKKYFPSISESKINEAIQTCCKSIEAPRPRKEFIECILKHLK